MSSSFVFGSNGWASRRPSLETFSLLFDDSSQLLTKLGVSRLQTFLSSNESQVRDLESDLRNRYHDVTLRNLIRSCNSTNNVPACVTISAAYFTLSLRLGIFESDSLSLSTAESGRLYVEECRDILRNISDFHPDNLSSLLVTLSSSNFCPSSFLLLLLLSLSSLPLPLLSVDFGKSLVSHRKRWMTLSQNVLILGYISIIGELPTSRWCLLRFLIFFLKGSFSLSFFLSLSFTLCLFVPSLSQANSFCRFVCFYSLRIAAISRFGEECS
jgi:hypothetical protein